MKGRSPLALTELLIMLLIFSLASALCLQAFAKADAISNDSRILDLAVTDVQNAAEAVKACRGDLSHAAKMLDGEFDGQILVITQGEYTVTVTPIDSDTVGKAEIRAADPSGNEIFIVTAAWQKEASHE